MKTVGNPIRVTTMNVSLSARLERFVQKEVDNGRYNSTSEVVREAIQLLDQRERFRQTRLQDIRKKINDGWEAIQRGDVIDGEEFFASLAKKERRRKRA